ncbi:hypothetical protein [Streptomyces sp. NPDC058542]|uniref:hypothetical protein n=1 Tax=Streptomyces sp. NPDC058542 TaxID=3346543 RepID=UPI00364EF289
MRSARVRLHRSLPYTRLWTCEGTHVGPAIEARRGSRLRIAWENDRLSKKAADPAFAAEAVAAGTVATT